MRQAQVLSVNAGKGVVRPYATGPVTAIDKHPVNRIEVRDPGPKHGGLGSGVVGDDIGDRKHHGGATQAVYAYAREDQEWWEHEIGRPIPPGGFGENLTTVGVDTTHALVGEIWRLGDVVLKVEVPRIPCATFAGHMRIPHWVKRFTAEGRTGAYLSVVTPGAIVAGAPIEVERPDHDIDLLLSFRAAVGDMGAARRVLAAEVLHPDEHAWLAERSGRRSG